MSDRVTLINRDSTVVRLFLKWLDRLGVERDRLRFCVSIHESADVRAAVRHWSEVTGTPAEGFGRSTLKRHNPKTPRYNTGDDYFGCLTIDVCKSRQLYRSIEGWWRGIAAWADPVAEP